MHPNPSLPAQESAARGAAMTTALSAMLDRVKGSREALPLMAALERSLQTQGLSAIDNASHSVLARIAGQLATLPAAPQDSAMLDLQTYLLDRLTPPAPAAAAASAPVFVSTDALEVSEGSLTDFMAVQEAARARST